MVGHLLVNGKQANMEVMSNNSAFIEATNNAGMGDKTCFPSIHDQVAGQEEALADGATANF